jgi:hypothetical protein
MRRAASWALAVGAAVALTTGLLAIYTNHTVFDSDGFADRADAALRSDAVSAEAARRLTDAAIRVRPDLIAVRPLVASAAEGVVRSSAFRSLVRGAARDVHRSVFDRGAGTVTLTVVDAGVLLNEALAHVRPDLERRIPDALQVRIATAAGDWESAVAQTLDFAERIRIMGPIALVLALLLAIGAVMLDRSRRDGVFRVGVAVAVVAGLMAVLATVAPPTVTADPGLRAVLETWLDPLAVWCWAAAGAGAIVALAAAALLRPVLVVPLVRRGWTGVIRTPDGPWRRGLRAVLAIVVGVALIVDPLTVLELVAVSAGLLLVLAGVSELLRLAGEPEAPSIRRVPRAARIVPLAAVLVAGVTVAAVAAGGDPDPVRVGRCNGQAALCDRPLDQIAFIGTHNSMAADREPGWLFAAQDAGIDAQLQDGVRALLIDTHYGFATPRGVATDLSRASKSREKIVSEVGERFVVTAERLRERIGYNGGGTRSIFLCHAFCEVGATPALEALRGVHRFLVAHPEEVLILSIEDDTDAADTTKVIRDSGLINEVYRGPAKPPWPTLRDMIERNERVLVLIENDPGTEPWMHKQSVVAQETPYRFNTVAELAAPTTCRPNRGGTVGSLLLVNHWVDTSPAPRKTIAREVNARGFLEPRLTRCREQRGLLPTIIAVDFYRQGGVFATADRVTLEG